MLNPREKLLNILCSPRARGTLLILETMDQQLNHGYSNLKCYDIISRNWADKSSPRICTLQPDGPFVISLYLQTGLVSSGTLTEHVYAFWICACMLYAPLISFSLI